MATAARATTARPETLEKRRRILAAALETFGAKGYHHTPLSEIADQVGMTHAGVLHHFGSKENLLLEVLAYRDEADLDGRADHALPTGAALFDHLADTARANAQRPGIVQAFAVLAAESVTADHPASAFFRHRYSSLRGQIADAAQAVADDRGQSLERPAAMTAAAAIVAAMDGLQVQWLLAPDAIDLGDATASAITAILADTLGSPTD